jgi:hypothetical protein
MLDKTQALDQRERSAELCRTAAEIIETSRAVALETQNLIATTQEQRGRRLDRWLAGPAATH